MYLYRIGYYSYEDSGEVVLLHKKKISKKVFRNMFVEATLELLLNRRDLPFCDSRLDEGEWKGNLGKEYKKIFPKDDEISFNYTKFYSIYTGVAKIMVELFGFELAQYEQVEEVDGWGGIVDPNRDFGEEDELLNTIRKKYWKIKNG